MDGFRIKADQVIGGLKLYKHTIKYTVGEGSGIGYAYFVSTRKEPYTVADMYATAPIEAFLSWAGPLKKITQISQSGPTTHSAYGVSQTGGGSSVQLGTAFESDTVTDY